MYYIYTVKYPLGPRSRPRDRIVNVKPLRRCVGLYIIYYANITANLSLSRPRFVGNSMEKFPGKTRE